MISWCGISTGLRFFSGSWCAVSKIIPRVANMLWTLSGSGRWNQYVLFNVVQQLVWDRYYNLPILPILILLASFDTDTDTSSYWMTTVDKFLCLRSTPKAWNSVIVCNFHNLHFAFDASPALTSINFQTALYHDIPRPIDSSIPFFLAILNKM